MFPLWKCIEDKCSERTQIWLFMWIILMPFNHKIKSWSRVLKQWRKKKSNNSKKCVYSIRVKSIEHSQKSIQRKLDTNYINATQQSLRFVLCCCYSLALLVSSTFGYSFYFTSHLLQSSEMHRTRSRICNRSTMVTSRESFAFIFPHSPNDFFSWIFSSCECFFLRVFSV